MRIFYYKILVKIIFENSNSLLKKEVVICYMIKH